MLDETYSTFSNLLDYLPELVYYTLTSYIIYFFITYRCKIIHFLDSLFNIQDE